MKDKVVCLGKIKIGTHAPLALIAGPCVIEDEKSALSHAKKLKKIAGSLHLPLIYKSSYDKANRSSIRSFRGVGLERGLKILEHVRRETGLPVLTDVHTPEEAGKAAMVADILQIPAFLCRQTDLLVAAAKTDRPVNVKKGQFMSPWEMKNVVEKLEAAGCRKILLTERGTFFGYNRLVNDFRSIPLMKQFGYPVIYDATHSVQEPGGQGNASGGERQFVPILARAGVSVGADGIFLEVHENPDKAPSDGANMVSLESLPRLLDTLLRIRQAVSRVC